MISRAIGFEKGFQIAGGNQFETFEIMLPKLSAQDILVKTLAVSVNPVDTKLRQNPKGIKQPHILGFDSVGIITELGEKVTDLAVGDRVIFAGTTKRFGSNSEHQVVDSRITAKLPEDFPIDEMAALPLTFLTAYEALFEKMNLIPEEAANTGELLIINGAGGVGSMAIQLAKWAGMTVLATASRKESRAWIKEMGADHLIDHHQNITEQVHKLGFDFVPNILILHSTDQYFNEMAALVAPFGHIASIVETSHEINLRLLKNKAASFDWEYMFAKTDYDFKIESQGEILAKLIQLLQAKKIQSTLTKVLPGFSPETFFRAHQMIEDDQMIGKLVIHF